ncbi:secreted RxLR effector protein 161-like [Manihot esculenta]|uniref:secreted RxLR effector protein 161-like n=1 Tax=Manihot esculenta TaxID=3983 RepID=UPI001CC5B3E7|nr:secreted RxLR effector protein 161-like [Manihot esculenta]
MGLANCKSCHVSMEARLKTEQIDDSPSVDATLCRSVIGNLRYLILRYVKGTTNHRCHYTRRKDLGLKLTGYSDSDFTGDVDDRKSTTSVIYFLRGNPITWVSQKQKVVALSSCEAKYVAETAGACQEVWLARLLGEMQKVK